MGVAGGPAEVLQVLYQGEVGAYSEEAAQRLFPGVPATGRPTFAAAFAGLGAGRAAVLPVENSLGGVVQEVSDLLWAHPEVVVLGEHFLPVRHQLLTATPAPVRRALSHPQALAQCAGFLAQRGIEPVPHPDTAGAARWVSEHRVPGEAAIASAAAAARYGLQVVADDIADRASNRTRFLVCAPGTLRLAPPALPAKLSLGFVTAHSPGALAAVLLECSQRRLNLSRLDSRPIPDLPFEYRFYADLELDPGQDCSQLMAALGGLTSELRVFGLYPRAQAT